MSKPKISVILPVYNVEDYLTETLDSILSQSMIDDIEVIMVDDGSTDESRYIIERYALDYDNFHAYHKDNEGQAITRNNALKLAKGDYIHFLDSDDFIPSTAYETLYGIALKNNSDMVICNVLRFGRYHIWEDILFQNSFRDITEVISSATLNDVPSLVWDTITCNKLYRRQFLLANNIEFPKKKISFEDIPFSLESHILSERISITPEICYYWRLRGDNTSTTQQDLDVASIWDRLEILKMVHQLLVKYDVDRSIRNEEYLKWISHDLKFFIKRFDHFPKEHHRQLFDEIRELVMLIPDEIIESLNSYKKAIFRMVRNNDFDNFVLLAPLENDLFENPHIPQSISDEYKGYFDFKKAMEDEELIVELTGIDSDESNVILEYNGKVNYLSDDCEYVVTASLAENGNSWPLEVKDSQIIIPLDILKDRKHAEIEVCYEFGDFKKRAILKNRHRQSVKLDDFYLDLDISINSSLFIDVRNRTDNHININDIAYEDDEFILKCSSNSRIDGVYIENVITFERIDYPVEYANANEFTFRIPESDLLDAAIKKWEINCEDSANSIELTKFIEFFKSHNKIRFVNTRNKILIENDVYNTIDELYSYTDLKSDLASLKNENYRLKKQNAQLNDRILEFKSRKIVKIADKMKF